jgi:exonuclease III
MVKIVSWNVNQRLLLDEVGDADVVLLQEAPAAIRNLDGWDVFPGDGAWSTGRAAWRTAVAVRRNSGLTAEPLRLVDLHDAEDGMLAVSRSGTLAAVRVAGPECPELVVVSAYARWEHAHASATMYADANAHRILSDLSVFLTSASPKVDLVVAGDWNLLHGYNEAGWPENWKHRYATVFARAEVLGLTYLGPQFPNGRQASPWPEELPHDSRCVPTYRSRAQSPETAARQLDHVFATPGVAARATVRALNAIDEWGPSDHCRLAIDVV